MKNYLILLTLATFPFVTWAQSNNNFTLQQCVDYALENSAKAKNAKLDEQLAAEKVKEIQGIGLPQVKLSHTLMDNLKVQSAFLPSSAFSGGTADILKLMAQSSDPVLKGGAQQALAGFANAPEIAALPFGVKYNLVTQASVTQLIFDGSYLVGLQAANTYKELSSKSTELTKKDIIANVNKAYLLVLVNEERKKIFSTNISRLDTLLRQTRALNQSGFVEKIDVSRLEVAYNNLTVEKQKFDNLYELSVELLKLQMGMAPNENLKVSQKISDFQSSTITESTIDFNNRSEYGLVKTQIKLYELDLKNQKFSKLPSIAAFGNFGFNNGANKFEVYTTKNYGFANIGLAVNMPLFDGFQKYRKAQQAKINIQKGNNTLLELEKGIAAQTKIAQLQLKNSTETLSSQKNNMVLAEEIARVTKEKYAKGVGSSLEVTNAESELKTAQINYYEALYNSLVNKVELDAALGVLK
ncbi:MAG: hypothetical protein RLZZ175_1266 [Bacteroidota bacterium]|jgi:outer membrane protein TolC